MYIWFLLLIMYQCMYPGKKIIYSWTHHYKSNKCRECATEYASVRCSGCRLFWISCSCLFFSHHFSWAKDLLLQWLGSLWFCLKDRQNNAVNYVLMYVSLQEDCTFMNTSNKNTQCFTLDCRECATSTKTASACCSGFWLVWISFFFPIVSVGPTTFYYSG